MYPQLIACELLLVVSFVSYFYMAQSFEEETDYVSIYSS